MVLRENSLTNDPDPPVVSQAEGYLLALSHLKSFFDLQNNGRGYLRDEDQAASEVILQRIDELRMAVTAENRDEKIKRWKSGPDWGSSQTFVEMDITHMGQATAAAYHHDGADSWVLRFNHYSQGGLSLYCSDPKQLRAQLVWAIVALDAAVDRHADEEAKKDASARLRDQEMERSGIDIPVAEAVEDSRQ